MTVTSACSGALSICRASARAAAAWPSPTSADRISTRLGPGRRRDIGVRWRRGIQFKPCPPGGRFGPVARMVWDALRARRHGKPSGRGERSHVREPQHTRRASAWSGWTGRPPSERLRDRGGRRGKPHLICACPRRRLASLAVRAAARPRLRHQLHQLPGAHACDVRELHSRFACRAGASGLDDRALDRSRISRVALGAAVDLPGRVRVSRFRASRGAARPRPLHACGR